MEYGYHNLMAYKKAKELVIKIIKINKSDTDPKSWNPIYNQLLRSSGSIGANIAEGYGRNNSKEYKQFLGIARGSCLETQHWLEIIHEGLNLEVSDIINLNEEVIKILTTMVKNFKPNLYALRDTQ